MINEAPVTHQELNLGTFHNLDPICQYPYHFSKILAVDISPKIEHRALNHSHLSNKSSAIIIIIGFLGPFWPIF